MTWREAMAAAGLATIRRGRWWVVALAAFLVRGGLLLLLPAIVVLPTPAELALVVLHPSLTGSGVGSFGPALPGLLAWLAGSTGLVLIATGFVGAWLDARLVAEIAGAGELGVIGRPMRIPLGRGLAVRLLAHAPTAAVAVAGLAVIAAATYSEFLAPGGSGSLAGRVALRAPLAIAASVGTWLVGEAWGGMAIRRLGRGIPLGRALVEGLESLVRPSGLATLTVTTVAVAVPVVMLWLVAGPAFQRLWPLVVDRADPTLIIVALGLFVGTWGAGLWLLAIAVAWRSAAWTAEALRRG